MAIFYKIKFIFFIFIVKFLKIFMGKLHFTILNYTPDYILHHKLFEYTFYTINYYICYTLHYDVNFIVMLDGNLEYMTYTCALLK